MINVYLREPWGRWFSAAFGVEDPIGIVLRPPVQLSTLSGEGNQTIDRAVRVPWSGISFVERKELS